MRPSISIVVPAFNEEKSLPGTLSAIKDALTAFQESQWHSEIIVCDNNSTDATAAIARESGARVVFEPINQISRARNCGASVAAGNWLVFVDADSTPSRELFSAMGQSMSQSKTIGGGSTVQMAPLPFWATILVGTWNLLSRVNRWMAGSFIFCEKQAFLDLNGFDNELFVSEEIDFSRRLKRLARRQQKKVVILHRHPLLTSPRKLHLYRIRESFRFVVSLLTQGGKAFRDRSTCFPWYDGRR
jgi:glycosyltransferase involved in cell wall biosynthesis